MTSNPVTNVRAHATVAPSPLKEGPTSWGDTPWFPVALLGIPLVLVLIAFLVSHKISIKGRTVWMPPWFIEPK